MRRRAALLVGYALALAAGGLWLVELTNHEATQRQLREAEDLRRGLEWVNGLQALEIRLLKSEQEIGRAFFSPLRRAAGELEANDEHPTEDG